LVLEGISRDASSAGWHGAHTGIGTLQLELFGTEEQKRRYLPKLASAEWIAAYALTEPQAGSDAMNIKTRADLSNDGSHYVLNGQKMWITNGGVADLFTVFAKVNGDKFTAFVVERAWPGVSTGAEEKKMGIKGSSTTAVYFENVKVPIGNVLGEIGRGHKIAFNILNLGRLKIGPSAVGAAKHVLAASIKYAKERVAFGKPIAEFGMICHKLAEMAIRIYAAESMSYRTAGLIQNHSASLLESAEEFAIEASYVKVFATEVLDYVVDEGVQIHGGYGYHQDYLVERAYRDSRINRIFEGTNEINRILATSMLIKRAQRGQLALVDAVKAVPHGVPSAKSVALFALGVAFHKFKNDLENQQEVLAAITDIAMNAYAMESVVLRTSRLKPDSITHKMSAVFQQEAMETVASSATSVITACSEGEELRSNLALLRGLTETEPVDAIRLRREIAGTLLDAGRYAV